MSGARPVICRQWPRRPKYWVGDDGSVLGVRKMELRMQAMKKAGHRHFTIRHGGRTETYYGHIVVAETWLGPRPDGLVVAHNNGDGGDNRVDNLRWATHSENEADKTRHGRTAWGERHPHHKLTTDAVRCIRAEYARGGVTQQQLADRYGVKIMAVNKVLNGKTWKHVAD